ncbi:MAG: hypothetical protein ACM31L_00170 [Actinomycetota bacterium]
MTYDVLIRHTMSVPFGDGCEHRLEMRHIDAASEEDAFRRLHHGPDDHIACIDAWHHQGIDPYSVEIGDPDFPSDARCPKHGAGSEPRVG